MVFYRRRHLGKGWNNSVFLWSELNFDLNLNCTPGVYAKNRQICHINIELHLHWKSLGLLTPTHPQFRTKYWRRKLFFFWRLLYRTIAKTDVFFYAFLSGSFVQFSPMTCQHFWSQLRHPPCQVQPCTLCSPPSKQSIIDNFSFSWYFQMAANGFITSIMISASSMVALVISISLSILFYVQCWCCSTGDHCHVLLKSGQPQKSYDVLLVLNRFQIPVVSGSSAHNNTHANLFRKGSHVHHAGHWPTWNHPISDRFFILTMSTLIALMPTNGVCLMPSSNIFCQRLSRIEQVLDIVYFGANDTRFCVAF